MTPRILAVDDVHDNILLLQAILEDFPATIDVAYDGETALELVSENNYAVILMDVNMPGMSGFECVKRIRAQENLSHVPIIFITALGDDKEYVSQGYHLGAVDYITKPVDEDMLCSKINIFLELERKQKETDEALRQVRQLHRDHEQILNYMAEGIIGLDSENFITFANTAACTLLTTSKDDLLGKNAKSFVDPHMDAFDWGKSDFVQIFKDGQCNHIDDSFFWRNEALKFPVQYTQSSIWDGDRIKGGIVVFQDISERKDIEDKLVNLAKFDQLTGLANRILYKEFLEKAIEVSKRNNAGLYIIFIDLDHFKEVNDTLGHDAGDLLLVQASERLRNTLRSCDLVSRLGGDEFSVILQNAGSEENVASICKKIITAFQDGFHIFGQEVFVGCSLGVAKFPEDGADASAVTKSADTAMYSAKQSGRNDYKFFHKNMHARVQAHMEVASELRSALKDDQILPYFQAKVDIKTNRLVGAEALARWSHEEKGMISPGVFIPVAEDTGLISDVSDIMLIKSGDLLSVVSNFDALPSDFRVSVNLSAKQIQTQHFSSNLLALMDKHQIPCEKMELELTESTLMHSYQLINKELSILRERGVHVSVDDFGTGYSSLAYLKRLPIDTLKIDRAFVRDIGQDSADEAIIRAIINLGHSLDMKVLAEGVETDEQLDFLIAEDCDQVQGFLLSRPASAEEFSFWVKGKG